MRLKLFKTLWGFKGDYKDAVLSAKQHGFDGLEGPAPATSAAADQFAQLLAEQNLEYIAEIATTGTYIPNRSLAVRDHLQDLDGRLKRLKGLKPLFITCLGGCDAWSREQSLGFLSRAIEIAGNYGHTISFETHRGRSLFNPWITRTIVDIMPELRITCDFSHWCVVCEGLQSGEEEIILSLVKHAEHVHGRIGYDQGAQVPDPRSPLYSRELRRHLKWWQWIWQQHSSEKRAYTTVTPEFGSDGYDYRDPVTGTSLIEPEVLNHWMAGYLREQYQQPGRK